MDYAEFAQRIKQKTNVTLSPASSKGIEAVQALGLPTVMIEFFTNFEPKSMVQINKVRLWPISNIIEENEDYVPGADIYPHGFVVFATTLYGDTYCVDLNETNQESKNPIVIIPHEIDFDGEPFDFVEDYRKQISESFEEFLEMFINETIDIKPKYKNGHAV